MQPLTYLSGYSDSLQADVRRLIADGELVDLLRERYPTCHDLRSEQAVYDYAVQMKNRHLKTAPALSKVVYDPRIHVIQHALGQHTRISRIQGSQLKAKYEIRLATVFRQAPLAFLDMILIHELAHFREKDHNKAFYRLCCRMDADYHQLEFDLRLYLTCLDLVGEVYGD